MRITYIDEGGTSSREPVAVVAAVMLDGDGHVALIQEELEDIVKMRMPEFGEAFYFHATDIWNGSEFFKDREKWPFEKRFEILRDVSLLFQKHEIPISVGVMFKDKIDVSDHSDSTPEIRQKVFHTLAFIQSCNGVEEIMRNALSDEITFLIAEDCPTIRKDLKEMGALLRSPSMVKDQGLERFSNLPFRHIKEGPYFAEKKDSRCLQLADFCAFVVRGFYAGSTYQRNCLEELYKNIEPQIYQHFEDGRNRRNKKIVLKRESDKLGFPTTQIDQPQE